MSRPTPGPNPCIVGCGQIVKRSTAGKPVCRACFALAEQIFRRSHSPLDADWIAARNAFFGDRRVLVPAIQVERTETAAA